MSRISVSPVVVLLTLILAGCGDDDESGVVSVPADSGSPLTSGESGTGAATDTGFPSLTPSTSSADAVVRPTRPRNAAWPKRETPDGIWVLRTPHIIPPNQNSPQPMIGENPMMLVRMTSGTEDAPGTIEKIAARMDFEQLAVADASVTGDSVRFDCLMPDGETRTTFRGRFDHGVIVGSMVDLSGNNSFIRLVPSDERTFARIPAFVQLPAPEVEQFNQASQSPVPEEDAREFARMFPSSPLIAVGHQMAITSACQEGKETASVEKLIAAYAKQQASWEARMGLVAEVEGLQRAVTTGYDPVWCLKHLDITQEKLKSDDTLKGLSERIDMLRKQTRYNQAVVFLSSDDKAKRAEGRTIAEDMMKTRRHDVFLTVHLADAARLDDRKQDAIDLYAELVALPMQERMLQELGRNSKVERILPTERLETLWKEVHGGTDGMADMIQKTYEDRLVSFTPEPPEPRADEPGNRTVLAELFTGVRCPLSIGAEVAMAGLARNWPDSTVVTLRYHVHMAGQVPGHNPLANEDSEARYFNYYRTNFTPRVFLDGTNVPGTEGGMVDAERLNQGLSSIIKQLLEQKSDVSIDLTAIRQDDVVQISCAATSTGEFENNVRLRLVLAESGVNFQAYNGIRQHDMVARKLLGGDNGVAPAEEKLEWQGSVDVEELRTELHDSLTRYETNMTVEFSSTPLALNNLSVVAIVQEDGTHKVLQCRVVRIE
jgi:hypothetical protein